LETQACISQAAASVLKMLSAVLAGRVALANTNREDVKEKKIPFAELAAHVTQANIYQQDAEDRKTPSAQIVLHVLQDITYQERALEEITPFVHDAPQLVPQDNSFLDLAPNLPMLFAADAEPVVPGNKSHHHVMVNKTRDVPLVQFVQEEHKNQVNARCWQTLCVLNAEIVLLLREFLPHRQVFSTTLPDQNCQGGR